MVDLKEACVWRQASQADEVRPIENSSEEIYLCRSPLPIPGQGIVAFVRKQG